jgi:hypothetical protein
MLSMESTIGPQAPTTKTDWNGQDFAYPHLEVEHPVRNLHIATPQPMPGDEVSVWVQVRQEKKGWVWAVVTEDQDLSVSKVHATMYDAYTSAKYAMDYLYKSPYIVIEPLS